MMKIRMDFVTNSSSSSYIVLSVNDDIKEKIYKIEGFDDNTDWWGAQFKLNKLEVAYEEGYFRYLGYTLSEHDLRCKTLNQLEIDLVDDLNRVYGLGVTIDDIFFDVDVIYN